jgi:hypothetical protein
MKQSSLSTANIEQEIIWYCDYFTYSCLMNMEELKCEDKGKSKVIIEYIYTTYPRLKLMIQMKLIIHKSFEINKYYFNVK